MTNDFQERVRRLRNAVEPVAAGVYFAPEALAAYAALGFDGSPAVDKDGVARPQLTSYFTSRGACMGQVPGEVVATAFGCFNPPVVVAAVAAGWQIASREAILDARERGATEMLHRVLGEQPDGLERVTDLLRRGADAAPWAGRPLYSGLRSLGYPASPTGAMWRAADLLREHRGDIDELLDHLDAWSEAIIAAGSYPKRVAGVSNVGGGPHFGSGLTIDTAAELYQEKT